MRSHRSDQTPCLRVDAACARQVAEAFTAAPSQPWRPIVHQAYAQLTEQADRWYRLLTDPDRHDPVRVVFTRCPGPYADASELSQSVRGQRLLELESTNHDHDRRHPLLDNALGGGHDRFRAVHDIVSHGRTGCDFSRNGEFTAWLVEDAMYRGLAPWALATELHAHHSVRWTSGDLAPYKATLLDVRLLTTSMARAEVAPGPRWP